MLISNFPQLHSEKLYSESEKFVPSRCVFRAHPSFKTLTLENEV